MPYREVIRVRKLGGQLSGHSRSHARRVALSATEPFSDRLIEGREFLDLFEYQIAVGEEVDRLRDELIVIDDLHALEQELERQLREERDGWVSQLREGLLQLKDTSDGYFGPGASRKIFRQDPPRLPSDPEALHQVGQRAHDTLTEPEFDLEPAQQGVAVNPKMLASGLETPLDGLGDSLKRLEAGESNTRHTQSLKDEILEQVAEYEGKASRFFEAFFDLAGHERLASRLRRSSHISRKGGKASAGGDPGKDAEPGAGGAVTEGEPATASSVGGTNGEAAP